MAAAISIRSGIQPAGAEEVEDMKRGVALEAVPGAI